MTRRCLALLHGCLAELDCILPCSSSRQCCAVWLVQFSHLILTRTIHSHSVAANLWIKHEIWYKFIFLMKYPINHVNRWIYWPGRSHPAKLHFLPEVQIYRMFPREILCLMNSFSCGVSSETASMQCLRQMFLASSQSTSKLLVAWCSHEKKYECATPRASL